MINSTAIPLSLVLSLFLGATADKSIGQLDVLHDSELELAGEAIDGKCAHVQTGF